MAINKKTRILIIALLFSFLLCEVRAYSQSDLRLQRNDTDPVAALVDKIIQAQINYDYVSLDKLQRQLSQMEVDAALPPVTQSLEAAQDAPVLWRQVTQASSEFEKTQKLRQYISAVRKGYGICDALLQCELQDLGAPDVVQSDCYSAFLTSDTRWSGNRHARHDGWAWLWLGLTYAMKGDNQKSVACFTIGQRLANVSSANLWLLSDPLCGHILRPGQTTFLNYDPNQASPVTFYPAANQNFLQAQKEISAEQNDRRNLEFKEKYGN